MDLKKSVETIAEIEREFDVNSVRCENIQMWPLIRLALWTQLLHPEMNVMVQPYHKKTMYPLMDKLIRSTNIILKVLRSPDEYYKRLRSRERQLKELKNKGSVALLFFSRPEYHSVEICGKLVNPLLDPLIDFTRDKHRHLKVELDSSLTRKKIPRSEPTNFISTSGYFTKYKIMLKYRELNRIVKLDNFSELKKTVSELINGIGINENYFLNQAKLVKQLHGFFTEILSVIQPKVVFLSCYYYPSAMALIRACRKLSIKTIDVQHGKQGKYHGMYTNWTKIPEEGYELLPDFFWVWGEETKRNIQRWQPQGLKRNIPVIGGNLWLSQWIDNSHYEDVSGEYKDFINRLEQYEKIILYTAQPIPDPFPDYLLKAIRSSCDSWIWLIRLHRRQINQVTEIDDFLRSRGVDNYEIKASSQIFLYSLLRNVNHHLTCWSTVCYEALYFGVPTTIVHPSGAELYEEYIGKGIFTYAADAQDLLLAIEDSGKKEPVNEEVPYIETSRQRAEDALGIILGKK